VSEEIEKFEILAEWVIRKLRPLELIPAERREEVIKRWVLYSLGLDKLAQDIYLYLEKCRGVTTTEIAKEFNISPNTARKYLDDLHTLGLVDYIGREYRLEYDRLSKAIELALIPRIKDTLERIARIAKLAEREIDYSTLIEVKPPREGVTVKYYAPMRITKKIIDEWHKLGKKVRIQGAGPLVFDEDIDPEVASEVIEKIEAAGPLTISARLYAVLASRIKANAPIKVV